MSESSKPREDVVQKIKEAETIQQIVDLALLSDDYQKDVVFFTVRDRFEQMRQDLFKDLFEKIKSIWQADFLVTRSLDLLVRFWSDLYYPDCQMVFFNQLKDLVSQINDPYLLKIVFDSIMGNTHSNWSEICGYISIIQECEIICLIKQQVKKIINDIDSKDATKQKHIENLLDDLKDPELLKDYFTKILEIELKNSST